MPERSSTYHRAGPWQRDLARLHAAGLSAAAVADRLSVLYAPASFTRRQVLYWRRVLELPPVPVVQPADHTLPQAPGERRRLAWRAYQASRGWLCLLDRGVELPPGDVDLLCRLLALCEATRQGLLGNSGGGWKRQRLSRLVGLGLVQVDGTRVQARYRLAIQPPPCTARPGLMRLIRAAREACPVSG